MQTINDDKEFWESLKSKPIGHVVCYKGDWMGIWMGTHIAAYSEDPGIDSIWSIRPPCDKDITEK